MKNRESVHLEEIRLVCMSFPGATEDIKWEEHLCFNVGEKMFLISSPDRVPVSVSFKATDADFNELQKQTGFKPAPYLARYKWIYCEDIGLMSIERWKKYLKSSYELVRSGLPARMRKPLEAMESQSKA